MTEEPTREEVKAELLKLPVNTTSAFEEFINSRAGGSFSDWLNKLNRNANITNRRRD